MRSVGCCARRWRMQEREVEQCACGDLFWGIDAESARLDALERELRATQLAARNAKEQFGKRLGSKVEEAVRSVKPLVNR